MNLSGNAYRTFVEQFYVKPAMTLVVYDSFHLPFGTLKLRPKGGHGGHNGIRHVIQVAGTEEIPQLRVGIGKPLPVHL